MFGQKNIFYKTNIEDREKVHPKSAPLIIIRIFNEKENIFLQKILGFWRFSQIQGPGGKI